MFTRFWDGLCGIESAVGNLSSSQDTSKHLRALSESCHYSRSSIQHPRRFGIGFTSILSSMTYILWTAWPVLLHGHRAPAGRRGVGGRPTQPLSAPPWEIIAMDFLCSQCLLSRACPVNHNNSISNSAWGLAYISSDYFLPHVIRFNRPVSGIFFYTSGCPAEAGGGKLPPRVFRSVVHMKKISAVIPSFSRSSVLMALTVQLCRPKSVCNRK